MRKLNSILLGAFVLGAMVEALAVEPGLKESPSAAKPVADVKTAAQTVTA